MGKASDLALTEGQVLSCCKATWLWDRGSKSNLRVEARVRRAALCERTQEQRAFVGAAQCVPYQLR